MIIGFCGYPYNGKSEAAKRLVDNYAFIKMNFADNLKRMILTLRGVEHRHVYGTKADKEEIIEGLGVSGRYLMETLGTQWGRDMIKPSLWVDQSISSALNHLSMGSSVVYDDVRFHNEVTAIKDSGGIVIRIVRPGIEPDLTLPANREIADLKDDMLISNHYSGPQWEHNLEKMIVDALSSIDKAIFPF
jgi:hypothetical protein